MQQSNIYYRFDNRVSFGFPDEFFHFMWGYLLPTLVEISKNPRSNISHHLIRSCGPTMDQLTEDITRLLDYEVTIVPERSVRRDLTTRRVWVPRFDIGLMRSHFMPKEAHAVKSIRKMRKRLRRRPAKWRKFSDEQYDEQLTEALSHLRTTVVNQLGKLEPNSNLDVYKDQYLILKRSEQPEDFCTEKKRQKISPGYGIARRSLLGTDEAESLLRAKQFPVRVFEPGRHTMLEQISVYANCKGIIGIRGAEFANVIWMPTGSLITMIWPAQMKLPSLQEQQARLLGLNYLESKIDRDSTPTLDPDFVATALQQHEQSISNRRNA